MNLGELVECEGSFVYGQDTGRLVAKFSHEAEAESFVELVNGLPQSNDDWMEGVSYE